MHCEHSIFMNKSHPLWMALTNLYPKILRILRHNVHGNAALCQMFIIDFPLIIYLDINAIFCLIHKVNPM